MSDYRVNMIVLDSDEMYAELRALLEKQQSNIDQLKQCVSTLKKIVQMKHEKFALEKLSNQSVCGSTCLPETIPEIRERLL